MRGAVYVRLFGADIHLPYPMETIRELRKTLCSQPDTPEADGARIVLHLMGEARTAKLIKAKKAGRHVAKGIKEKRDDTRKRGLPEKVSA